MNQRQMNGNFRKATLRFLSILTVKSYALSTFYRLHSWCEKERERESACADCVYIFTCTHSMASNISTKVMFIAWQSIPMLSIQVADVTLGT